MKTAIGFVMVYLSFLFFGLSGLVYLFKFAEVDMYVSVALEAVFIFLVIGIIVLLIGILLLLSKPPTSKRDISIEKPPPPPF